MINISVLIDPTCKIYLEGLVRGFRSHVCSDVDNSGSGLWSSTDETDMGIWIMFILTTGVDKQSHNSLQLSHVGTEVPG